MTFLGIKNKVIVINCGEPLSWKSCKSMSGFVFSVFTFLFEVCFVVFLFLIVFDLFHSVFFSAPSIFF